MIPDEMQKEQIQWTELCTHIKDSVAHDLLSKMLELDHTKRIKATEVSTATIMAQRFGPSGHQGSSLGATELWAVKQNLYL